MIRHIVWKEFRETLRDGRFLWASLLVATMLCAALLIGWSRFEEARALREAAAAETREQWLAQGTKNPHAAAHYGIYAFKPATPLSLFDPGISDYVGTVALLEAHRQNEFKYKGAQDATALQRFGDLSAAMILQLLIPLLIVLLTFSSISGEREEGTLRQLLSLGVRRSTLVWGKALGVAATLSVTVIPAAIIGAVAIVLMSSSEAIDPHVMQGMPAKVMLLALCYLAYFWIFICLSLAVSILTKSSGAALTVLLGFWIVNGLLIPRAASDISRQVYATPSALEFAGTISRGRADGPMPHNPYHPNHIAYRKALLEQYGVSRIEDLPVNFYGVSLQADEEFGNKVYDRAYDELWGQFWKQNRFQQSMGVVAPQLAIKTISMGISGTDVLLHRDFSLAAEKYRRELQIAMNADISKGAAGLSTFAADWQYTSGPDVWAKVPPFDYDPPVFAVILREMQRSLLVLGFWLALSLALLLFASRRLHLNA